MEAPRNNQRLSIFDYPIEEEIVPVTTPVAEVKEDYVPRTNYTGMSFKKAFASARQAGLDIFLWNGKKYTTQLAEEVRRPNKVGAQIQSPRVREVSTTNEFQNFTPRQPEGNFTYTAPADASRPREEGKGAYGKMATDIGEAAIDMLLAGAGPSTAASKLFLNTKGAKYLPDAFNMVTEAEKMSKSYNPVIKLLKEQLINARTPAQVAKIKQQLSRAIDAEKAISEFGAYPKGLTF
jgi:hypothetical protein